MNFLVAWSKAAIDQMDWIVRVLPHRRKELATTLKAMSSTLRADPTSVGESREGMDRIWFVDDLIVTYQVDEGARTVDIGSVRLRPTP